VLPVLPGVSIKLTAADKARHIALVITSGPDGKWTARTTAQNVVVELKDVGGAELIFDTSWVFNRALFSSDSVSDYRNEHRTSQLKV
jgi:hypothetical protein